MVTTYTINLPSLKEGAIVATTTQTHTKTPSKNEVNTEKIRTKKEE